MKASYAALLTGLALCAAQPAAAQAVRLTHGAPIEKDNAALPRIAEPATPVTARINAALAVLDARWKKALRDCHAQGGPDAAPSRTVAVTMAGPHVVALHVTDDDECGGAHPDTGDMALAYDLDTGRPLDWTKLLPRRIVQSAPLDEADDGSRLGLIVSPTLYRLYMAAEERRSGHDPAWSSECRDALNDEQMPFQLWPDAKAGGVALLPNGLPHAVAACADAQVIPTATLRRLGVDAALLNAIDQAHAAAR